MTKFTDNEGMAPAFFTDLVEKVNEVFPYSRGPSHFSATGFEKGPMEHQLTRRVDPTKSVFEAIASLDGTMLHYGMEEAAKKFGDRFVTERRLYRVIDTDNGPMVVSGCNDLQGKSDDIGHFLCDWKRTKAYGVVFAKKEGASGTVYIDGEYHKKSWVMQLNVNRWLAASDRSYYFNEEFEKNWRTFFKEDNGREPTPEDFAGSWFEGYKIYNEPFKPDRLLIGAFLKDWDEKKARQQDDYPQANVSFVDQPFLSDADVEAYIYERIQYLDGYDDVPLDQVPLCSDEERWKKDDVFKVFDTTSKAKNPISRKNCSALEEAQEAAQSWEVKTGHPHRIEHFPGAYDKCVKYCDYRYECPFGQSVAADNFSVEE